MMVKKNCVGVFAASILSFAEVSKEKKRGEGEEKGKGRLGERGRKEEETSAIKPFQDGRRQGVGANLKHHLKQLMLQPKDGIL